MRKQIFGRRFKRDSNTRKALFRGLMRSIIIHGRIETTEAKAKSIKGKLEKLVTKAIKQGEKASIQLSKHFESEIVNALITQIAPKFVGRPGGYTRILRLGNRKKDDAPMVLLEWVEQINVVLESSDDRKRKEIAKDLKKSQLSPVAKEPKAKEKKKEMSENVKNKPTDKKTK